jgi:hypothetical protein
MRFIEQPWIAKVDPKTERILWVELFVESRDTEHVPGGARREHPLHRMRVCDSLQAWKEHWLPPEADVIRCARVDGTNPSKGQPESDLVDERSQERAARTVQKYLRIPARQRMHLDVGVLDLVPPRRIVGAWERIRFDHVNAPTPVRHAPG